MNIFFIINSVLLQKIKVYVPNHSPKPLPFLTALMAELTALICDLKNCLSVSVSASFIFSV